MTICRSNLLLVLDVKMLSNSQSSQTEASNQMHVGDWLHDFQHVGLVFTSFHNTLETKEDDDEDLPD